MPVLTATNNPLARNGAPESAAAPGLVRVERTGEIPLSFGQQRLWFLDQFDPGSSAYNIPFALRLCGALDLNALRQALNEIVGRHEVLRTVFPLVDGHPVQRIAPKMEIVLEEVILSGSNRQDREAAGRHELQAEAGRPFDLANGPLLRAKLFRVESDEWLLAVTMHHIVSDGWSGGIMVREFAQLYSAYKRGGKPPLPELKIQYADFAAWQREWMQGEVLEKQRGYWKQQLAGLQPLELPADFPQPATMSNRCASLTHPLPAELSRGMKKLALQERATLFMVLLAGWQWLLSWYSRCDDVACGTAVANRNRVEIEGLIGFFVNTLVLRTRVEGQNTSRNLLQQVRQTVLDAYRHQDLPFESLVEDLGHRDLARNPLFDVMFVLQNTPARKFSLDGLVLEEVKVDAQATKIDLTLFVEERGEELDCRLKYNATRFEAQTIERILKHWRAAIESMVGAPESRIGEVCLLSGEERKQMLVEWNSTATEYPPKCVHELFEEQARQNAGNVAVEYEGQRVTYGELNEQANRLANYLRKVGVGPEVRVGICMERSLEMVVGLLGILKAGGAYVPLDPGYPAEWLGHVIEDANVSALITQSQIAGLLPTGAYPVVLSDSSFEHLREESSENLASTSASDNLAYVIYTSGSTGRPKGVMVSHRALANHLQWRQRAYPLAHADRFLHKASLSFDIAGWEIFAPLIAGAQLVVCVPQGNQDSAYLAKLIAQAEVTVAHFSPSMLRAFLDEPLTANCRSLKRVFCGGEVMSTELKNRFQASLPATLHNQYGPTETTVDVLIWDCHREQGQRAVPIGRPIDNTDAYVLDSDLQPVPVGVPGELHIGGVPLARGYLNRPDLTAERYIPHPFSAERLFSAEAGSRLFKTGDLVRYRADGNIEFIGRVDRQVKVRGFRIELEAVEAILRSHSRVREAAVVVGEVGDGNQRLLAYVAGEAGPEELRTYIRSKLPEYMAPSIFVPIRSLPLTASGKVDRKALPEPETNWCERDSYVGPRNGEEEVLCGIFSDVLKLDRVGVNSNFFELGGHSLLATQIILRVRNIFGVEMPLRALFAAPTVAGLAEKLREVRGSRRKEPQITRVSREESLPLSYAQQRLWFLHQMDPESADYNVPLALRLKGPLDKKAILNSLNEIVRRHEVLRTSFVVRNGQPVQEVAQELRLTLDEVDLRGTPEPDREEEARRLAQQQAETPFDLAHGPLLRIGLLQLEDHHHVLLLTMHHIVSDVWSLGILVREFSRLYEGEIKHEEVVLEELKVQYADFAIWQRNWMQGEILDGQLGYWREQLAGSSGLELPTDRPRPAVMSHRGGSAVLRMGSEFTGKLKDLARREGVTLFMSLLGAWQVLLSKYAGQLDVAVGTAIANRSLIETEALIGFFVNTLVLRTQLNENPDYREVLKRVRQVTLGAYEHQDVPFEKLVEELSPQRDLSRSPLFQVMLVMQNAGQLELVLPGLQASEFELGGEGAKFDLLLTVREKAEGIEGKLIYARELYEQETVERMVVHLQRVIESMVAEPEKQISEVSLLSMDEWKQVVVEWNRTGVEYRPECVHELFEEQAKSNPAEVAVEYEGQELTYADLNRRTNQLGHYLKKAGVGPEVRVGICMERSLELVAGLLGILKAGGAYVPLDPAYPAERLAYMLEDSRAQVILTQEKFARVLSGYSGKVIKVDAEWEQISLESCEPPKVQLQPMNLAYVIYTSGSTGRPKGAMNTHHGLSNRLQWMQEAYQLRADDRILQKTPFTFDVSVWEFFWPLMAAARLVVAQPGGHQDVQYLRDLIERRGISTLHFVPSMLRAFLEAEDGKKLASVRRVICSGEALGKDLAQRCLDQIGAELHNLYGPTEAAIDVTYWQCEQEAGEKGVAIGRPIGNIQVYVLGEEMQPAGMGLAGELYLGGAGLGRGYLGRPDLTAERWVPNPFSETGGERLYCTGDQVRYRADGNLEFLGRKDHQVKVRGYRIELGEIEAALETHKDVKACAVIVRQNQPQDMRVVAFVVGGAVAGDLREYLKGKLPEYMVPSIFVPLESLPLTSSGKIDRKALLSIPVVYGAATYVAPRTPIEEQLCAIWTDVLRLERVGVEESFFDLGGHSLLATQVMSRVQEVFPMNLRLRVIFQTPTVSGLAREIESAMTLQAASQAPADSNKKSLSRIAARPILARKTSRLEQTLTKLENLSDEEVRAMLDARKQNA